MIQLPTFNQIRKKQNFLFFSMLQGFIFDAYSYPYKFPETLTYNRFSSKENYTHKTYPTRECTPKEMDPQSLKIEYAEKLNENSEFKIGWSFYTEQEIPSYLRPTVGGEIRIVRCLPPGKWVFLGNGYVTGINGNMVEAIVANNSRVQGKLGKIPSEFIATGNSYWRPMIGDAIFPVEKYVNKKLSVSPKIEIPFQDLFISQDLNQYSYEISKQGEEILKEKIKLFKQAKGRLLIEAFILTSGNREQLRIESLMRAQSISNYISNLYNIESEQIVTIGYGNDWLQTGLQAEKKWPKKNITSGIILRLLPEGF